MTQPPYRKDVGLSNGQGFIDLGPQMREKMAQKEIFTNM